MSRHRDLGPHGTGLPSHPRQPRPTNGPSPLDAYSLGPNSGAMGPGGALPPHIKSAGAPPMGAGGVPPLRPQRNAARTLSPSPGQGSFAPPPAGLTREGAPVRKDSRRGPKDGGWDPVPHGQGRSGMNGSGGMNGHGPLPAIMEPSGSRSGGGTPARPAMRVGPSSSRLLRALQEDGTIPIRAAPPSPALSEDSPRFEDTSTSALQPPAAARAVPLDRRPGSQQSNRSSASSEQDLFDASELPPPDLTKLQREAPQVLQNVIEAFERGGRQQQQRRDVEAARRPRAGPSTAAAETPGGRVRRTAVANQGYIAKPSAGPNGAGRRLSKLDDRSYPLTPGFRELEKALKQIHQDWKQTGITSSEKLDDEGQDIIEEEEEDDEGIAQRDRPKAPATFSPVGLALELIASEDPSSPPIPNSMLNNQSLSSFLRLKAKLEKALQLTIQSNYRQFDASVGGYNLVRQGIDSSQKRVAELRKRLVECREVLGAGSGMVGVGGLGMGASGEGVSSGRGVEMKALSTRKDLLDEMLKILESVEQLRLVPDKLEALLSEKLFLPATVLLVRSLKAISRPQMLEIPGLNDLRSYLTGQETSIMEILVEELHAHLYLKSFYCENRWRPYSHGQTTLPHFEAQDTIEKATSLQPTPKTGSMSRSASVDSIHVSPSIDPARRTRPSRLQRYLDVLALKPSHDPLLDEPELHVDEDRDALVPPPSPSTAAKALPNPGLASTQHAQNPEVDSFGYIESLIESLAVLGRLGVGLDAVLQRVPIEIYNLVENTLVEVDERNEADKRPSLAPRPASALLLSAGFQDQPSGRSTDPRPISTAVLSVLSSKDGLAQHRMSIFRINAAEATALESSAETLKDFFWTLYSKLDASLQGFRVLYEVAMRISERRDFKDTSGAKASNLLFSLLEVWKPIQSEVRVLLHDYLTDDENAVTSSRNPVISVADVLRAGKVQRDIGKQLFRFKDTDPKANARFLQPHEHDLDRALKLSMPGLAIDSAQSANTAATVNAMLTAGSASPSMTTLAAAAAGPSEGGPKAAGGGSHRVLVRPDAFNISILFGPTLAFLSSVRRVLPPGMVGDEEQGFGGFLDDFVLHVFLPQLEDKIAAVFQQAVGAPDAFQEDWAVKRVWPVPVAKSVSNLMVLIDSLCEMCQSTPFHREKYGRLIVSVISQYLQKCSDRYKELVTREIAELPTKAAEHEGATKLKLAAIWADNPELQISLQALQRTLKEKGDPSNALADSAAAERKLAEGHVIVATDIISSPKKIAALGNLFGTLDCFLAYIAGLRAAVNTVAATEENSSPEIAAMTKKDDIFHLPLTRDTSNRFMSIQKSYRTLADAILFTLRIELRIRANYFLGRAFREGSYVLSYSDATEPDPNIVDLNTALTSADEATTATLARQERDFVFAGLPNLLDQQLVSNARLLKTGNEQGFVKMSRNVLALQQNLKTLGYDGEAGNHTLVVVDFEKSRKFWDLAVSGPEALMEHIRTKPIFRFDDYKHLLCLQCGIDPASINAADGTLKSPTGPPPTSQSFSAAAAATATSDKRRRTYNESLIELHTLLLDESED